jgi:preprotein translocase subunit YajC
MGMLPVFVIFGVMIFLMYRSQKKQARERQEMLAAIKAGDKVITNGGIKGTIDKVKDDAYILKVADNVRIEIVHAGIAKVLKEKKDNNE